MAKAFDCRAPRTIAEGQASTAVSESAKPSTSTTSRPGPISLIAPMYVPRAHRRGSGRNLSFAVGAQAGSRRRITFAIWPSLVRSGIATESRSLRSNLTSPRTTTSSSPRPRR
jgi:hypothetical protein